MLSARSTLVAGIVLVLMGGVLTANPEAASPYPVARRPGCNSCGSSRAAATDVRATITSTWAISLNSFSMGVPYRFPTYATGYSSMTYLPPSPVMSNYLSGSYPPVSYPYPLLSSGPLSYPQPPTIYPSNYFMPPRVPPVYPSNYFVPTPNMPFIPTFGPADYLPNVLLAMNQLPSSLPQLSYPITNLPFDTNPATYQPMPIGPAPSLSWPSQQLSSPFAPPPFIANPYANSPGHTAASLRWAQGM